MIFQARKSGWWCIIHFIVFVYRFLTFYYFFAEKNHDSNFCTHLDDKISVFCDGFQSHLYCYHVRYLATLALGSSNSDQPFSKRIQQLRSTLSSCHFGTKMSWTIWYGSSHSNSGSSFPDLDRLTCCMMFRCLFVEIPLLRNHISLCQHVFYYGKSYTNHGYNAKFLFNKQPSL